MGQTFCMVSDAMLLDYLSFPNELKALPSNLTSIFLYPCLPGASPSPFFIGCVFRMTMIEQKNAMFLRVYYEES